MLPPARRLTTIRDAAPVPERFRGAAAAIGNLDGIHLGHRRLISTAIEAARRDGRPSAVVTFAPHSRAFFRPGEPHFTLTGEAEKEAILGALGLDLMIVLPFDAALAGTSAEDFVASLLAGRLGLSHVVAGDNFHFGRGRTGTPERLPALARAFGMGCTIVPAVVLDGEPVSSSRVRSALAAGDVRLANRLLGHRWFVSGPVIHGEKRGRTLGFPTANLRLDPGCRLRHGIYAVRAALGPGEVRGGVASFGRRPTFDDGAPLLETFLFDWSGDLYGRTIAVEFVGWIRGEERFPSAEALVDQMNDDAAAARALLAQDDSLPSFIGRPDDAGAAEG